MKTINRMLLASLLLSTVVEAQAGERTLTLVGPETRTAVICVDGWQHSKWYDWGGHRIFQRFAKMITGQDLAIVEAGQLDRDRYDVRIWIGRQPEVDRVLGRRLDALDDDGYLMVADGPDVYIAGKHWWGTNWAVHDLLERHAGCRWYLMEPRWWRADEDGLLGPGDIIPKADSIRIPAALDRIEEPDYKARWFRIAPMHSFRLRSRDHFHHALRQVFPLKMYDVHPQYIPGIGGKRERPRDANHSQPCESNPDVVRITADYAIARFDEHPELGTVSIGMNDTNRFCECRECLTVAPAEIKEKRARIAYAFFDFYNKVADRVAAKYPHKRLGCLAYAGLRQLPEDSIQLRSNIVPYLTLDSAQLFDPAQVTEFNGSVRKWNRISQRMGIYEYMYGGGFVIPRIYNRDLARNIKHRYGVEADGFYAGAYPNWGLDGPKYWLASKLLWDTSLDPDELLDQFYGDMFGREGDKLSSRTRESSEKPAPHARSLTTSATSELSECARTMKRYFEFLETIWHEQTLENDRSNYRWLRDPKQMEIFPPTICEEAQQMLDRAHDLAKTDEVAKRVEFFRTTFQITRVVCTRYAYAREVERLTENESADVDQLIAGLNKWMTAGDLGKAIENGRALGFAALSDTGDDMFEVARNFDQQPIAAATRVAETVVAQTVEGRSFASHEQLVRALNEAAPKPLADLIRRRALFVDNRNVLPAADGEITTEEWGKSVFEGRFHAYSHNVGKSISLLDKFGSSDTRVWCFRTEDKLCLAFDCQQDPATVGAGVHENDTTGWRDPAMLHDDCIVLNFFRKRSQFRSVRINANGAYSDHQGGKNDWNAVSKAAAKVTKTGWQAELVLELKPLNLGDGSDLAEISIARYTREPHPKKEGEFVTHATTLVPFPFTGGHIGHGNHPNLMTFRTGSQVVFAQP